MGEGVPLEVSPHPSSVQHLQFPLFSGFASSSEWHQGPATSQALWSKVLRGTWSAGVQATALSRAPAGGRVQGARQHRAEPAEPLDVSKGFEDVTCMGNLGNEWDLASKQGGTGSSRGSLQGGALGAQRGAL